jgi:purine nucleosidase
VDLKRHWMASLASGFALGSLFFLGLGPGAPAAAAAAPVPLIVDNDLSSNADDVGMLATAFALQQEGLANVLAVVVDSESGHAAIQANSWKCVAAIDNFYGDPTVSIGTQTSDNQAPDDDIPDLVGPCAQLAPNPPPQPATAVTVYRQALVSAADDSVVIATGGYLGALDALLNSPADGISPLTGKQLIAQKVKMLVVMGGSYGSLQPSTGWETNLHDDAVSAQDLSTNWPTMACAGATCPPIVWSGYEIGAVVQSGGWPFPPGQTISSTHPHYSPVRAAYEAFVGPNNSIPSWDLTPVYYAINPTDPVWELSASGTNEIDSNGYNTFIPSATGNQYYLKWADASTGPPTLADSLESLLDYVPPPPTGVTSPSNTAVPTISGMLAQGLTLNASTGSWTGNPTYSSYQWEECDASGANCSEDTSGTFWPHGAVGQTYVPIAQDAGHTIRVEVWASVPGASSDVATSPATTVVPALSNAPPVIAGTPRQGQTLTVTSGVWTPANGVTINEQWQRCDTAGGSCQAIPGATGNAYTLTVTDAGHTIRVLETADINGGVSTASSAPTAVIAAPAPGPAAPGSSGPVSTAKIHAMLLKAMAVSGSAARIGALMKHGGYTFSATAPSKGRLVLSWYAKSHGKNVVVANVSFVFQRAGVKKTMKIALTRAGRKLLGGARKMKITVTAAFTPTGEKAVGVTKTVTLHR